MSGGRLGYQEAIAVIQNDWKRQRGERKEAPAGRPQ
jgi:hypothetical protein